MTYTVYILYSSSFDKIYIGFTSNLLKRYQSHNFLATKGWTIKFRPWQVIYCEYFEDKTVALRREIALKSQKYRQRIRSNINTMYPSNGFISV